MWRITLLSRRKAPPPPTLAPSYSTSAAHISLSLVWYQHSSTISIVSETKLDVNRRMKSLSLPRLGLFIGRVLDLFIWSSWTEGCGEPGANYVETPGTPPPRPPWLCSVLQPGGRKKPRTPLRPLCPRGEIVTCFISSDLGPSNVETMKLYAAISGWLG